MTTVTVACVPEPVSVDSGACSTLRSGVAWKVVGRSEPPWGPTGSTSRGPSCDRQRLSFRARVKSLPGAGAPSDKIHREVKGRQRKQGSTYRKKCRKLTFERTHQQVATWRSVSRELTSRVFQLQTARDERTKNHGGTERNPA